MRMIGVRTLMTAGVFAAGVALVERRPWVAGVCLGALCYKPHFGLLIPVALIAGGHWRVAAVIHAASATSGAGWRADYSDYDRDLPRDIRLSSADRARFDLRLVLAQVEINPGLGAETFVVRAPAGFQPITLDELRRNGPMADPAP